MFLFKFTFLMFCFCRLSECGLYESLVLSSTMTKRFVVGEWGPCSVTCGEGVQRRDVYCRLFLELSRGTTTLKPDQCPGIKPAEQRSCTVSLCPLANT